MYIQQLFTLSSPERLCFKVGSCVSHLKVSLIVWTKSRDSVHKPQILKRKESRSGSNRGPSAYQPSALPLGHTGSHSERTKETSLHSIEQVRLCVCMLRLLQGTFFSLLSPWFTQLLFFFKIFLDHTVASRHSQSEFYP